MEFVKFKNILEGMQAREETEFQLYEMGLDISNIPNDLSGCVIELFDEIYPHSVGDIEYFCWELDFGAKYTDGCFVDEEGREWNVGTIEGLWLYLESREKETRKI